MPNFFSKLGFPLATDPEWHRDRELRAHVRATEANKKQQEEEAARERRRQMGLPEEESKPKHQSWLEAKMGKLNENRLSKQ